MMTGFLSERVLFYLSGKQDNLYHPSQQTKTFRFAVCRKSSNSVRIFTGNKIRNSGRTGKVTGQETVIENGLKKHIKVLDFT